MLMNINKINPFETNFSLSSPKFKNFGITHSLMNTFFECRRKFFYKIAGISPVIRNTKVFFGSEMHEILDQYYSGTLPGLHTGSLSKYLMGRSPDASPEGISRIIGVSQAYDEVYGDRDSNLKVNYAERSLEKKLLGVILRGKVDVDVSDGGVNYLMEHKTKAMFSPTRTEEYTTFLNIDQQTGIYLFLGGRENIIYNIIKNPSRKRVKKNEDIVQFVERIREEAVSKQEENFCRIAIRVPEDIQKQKMQEVKEKLKIIKRVCNPKKFTSLDKSIHFFRQSESCHMFNFCPYLNICASGKMNLCNYTLNNPVHGELNETKTN